MIASNFFVLLPKAQIKPVITQFPTEATRDHLELLHFTTKGSIQTRDHPFPTEGTRDRL